MLGVETLNSESETNLVFGCVTQKNDELLSVNVGHVHFALHEYLLNAVW